MSNCSRRCRRGPSQALGRRVTVCLSASARTPAPPGWCVTPSASPIACTLLDGALCRDQTEPATGRGGARPGRRHVAARSGARRRASHHSRRRAPDRRRRDRLCASQQHHPGDRREIHALAMVRAAQRLGGTRSLARLRQHQPSRHRR